MNQRIFSFTQSSVLCGLLAVSVWTTGVDAGELNVTGHLNVASNLTARSVTMDGQTRTTWPVGTDSFTSLGHSAVLAAPAALYSIVLTNHAHWDFGSHVAGRSFRLLIEQDEAGGRTNVWPQSLRWAENQTPVLTTQAGRWDVIEIVDSGNRYLARTYGVGFRDPCVTNCSYVLQFDGQNYLTVADHDDLDPAINTDMTVECWVKSGETDYGMVLATRDANLRGWNIQINPDGTISSVMAGLPDGEPAREVTTSGSYNDNQWHHVAMTWDRTTKVHRLWVDGAEQGNASSSSHQFVGGQAGLYFGFWPQSNEHWLTGELDEVRISKVVRYNQTFTPADTFTTDSDTLGHWRFNEGGGTSLLDETGYHHATPHGNPSPAWVEGR